MMMTTALKRRREDRDHDRVSGFTLIELLVSMAIFAMLLAVMMSVIIAMDNDMRKTQNVGNAALTGLRATQALDKELRYADWINSVGQGMAVPADPYLSFESLNGKDVSTCYQWRVHTGLLQQRSWVSGANLSTITTTSPSWQTITTGITNTTPFVVVPVPGPPQIPVVNPFQVQVDLVIAVGRHPAGHAETRLTITARNVASGPGSQQCNASNP